MRWLLFLFLGACVGLDDYRIDVCAVKPGGTLADDPCNAANADQSIDPCIPYQCVDGRCLQKLRDFDRDGDPDAVCGGSDCDDKDPAKKTCR
jgi:hypothetical protein